MISDLMDKPDSRLMLILQISQQVMP